ncbi:MAG: sugar phosphate isomerase/epimerase [Candidatus Sumerlaeota bacterium]|nr:sugar phosphate isomerase/epimerase [Candidatus Sumerlaeota bacterium]
MAKIGMSTYSLSRLRKTGEFSFPFAIDWIADNGGEFVEFSDAEEFDKSDAGIEALRRHAGRRGIEIADFIFPARFVQDDPAERRAEVERVKKQIDVARKLGVRFVRHDVAHRPAEECGTEQFDRDLPLIVETCREIADYAAPFGIATSIENHGLHVQAGERVRRVILGVNRPNFRTTIDVGNFVCVDEEPIAAVQKNLPYASFIHVKDFHRKRAGDDPGEGWRQSPAGNYWRAAIAGHGDIRLKEILQLIKKSGYDGHLSLEFEGLEDPRLACRIGLQNIRRYWNEA